MTAMHGSFGPGQHCDCDRCEGTRDVARQIRNLAELYLYDGDSDQPINDGYGAFLAYADSIELTEARTVEPPVREQETR